MVIILDILNKQKARWLIIKKNKILAKANFSLSLDQDKLLLTLDKLFKKHKIKFTRVYGLSLLVHEASLTQVKVFTATINTFAWYYDIPCIADWHYLGKVEDDFKKITADLKKIKRFKPLIVTYQRPPDITISKKIPKFTISK